MHDFFLHKTLNFTEVLLCDETLVSLIPPGPNCRGKCEKNAINVFRYHQCLTATHSLSHCGPLPWLSLSPLHTPSLCCSWESPRLYHLPCLCWTVYPPSITDAERASVIREQQNKSACHPTSPSSISFYVKPPLP